MELIPGVQEGKRLTLDSLNRRIADLEGVVAKLSEDFYSDAKTPADETMIDPATAFTDGGCVVDLAYDAAHVRSLQQENKALAAEVARLTEERDNALADSEFWHQESGKADDLADTYREELEDLRSTLRNL